MNDINPLIALAAGKYLCPVAFPREFEHLEDPDNAAAANAWLQAVGQRLARVGEEGAFFMAPARLGPADTARVKEELLRFRDVYGPSVRMLDLIRHGKEEFMCQMGEKIQLAEIEAAVNRSTTLETQLRNLQSNISNTSAKFSNRELLKKLLEHLEKEGYLLLLNANTEVYAITGKIDQLSIVLQVVAEHQPSSLLEDVREEDIQMDLLGETVQTKGF